MEEKNNAHSIIKNFDLNDSGIVKNKILGPVHIKRVLLCLLIRGFAKGFLFDFRILFLNLSLSPYPLT